MDPQGSSIEDDAHDMTRDKPKHTSEARSGQSIGSPHTSNESCHNSTSMSGQSTSYYSSSYAYIMWMAKILPNAVVQ